MSPAGCRHAFSQPEAADLPQTDMIYGPGLLKGPPKYAGFQTERSGLEFRTNARSDDNMGQQTRVVTFKS